MVRLRGRALQAGVGLGLAKLIRNSGDIPSPPESVWQRLLRAQRGEPLERVDVVLIVTDYRQAVQWDVPWANVVGIAAEKSEVDAPMNRISAVVGVSGLFDAIQDEELVLLDGDQGVLLINPTGSAVAAYQAEKERIAPRSRVFVDAQHLPARTLQGRHIRVLSRAAHQHEVRAAVAEGADALYIPEDNLLFSAAMSDEEQLEALINLASLAAGEPLEIAGDIATLSAQALLRAAVYAPILYSLPIELAAESFLAFQVHLAEQQRLLIEEDTAYRQVLLAARLSPGDALPEDLSRLPIGRLIVEMGESELLAEASVRSWAQELVYQAAQMLIPVEISLPQSDPENWRTALELGIVGLIVAPDEVQQVKEWVRGYPYTAESS
jgi:hypothetical protein